MALSAASTTSIVEAMSLEKLFGGIYLVEAILTLRHCLLQNLFVKIPGYLTVFAVILSEGFI